MIHGTCKKWLMAVALGIMIGEAVAQVNHVEPPLMGWSSWNTYRVNISEVLIKKQYAAMTFQSLNDARNHLTPIYISEPTRLKRTSYDTFSLTEKTQFRINVCQSVILN